MSRKINNFRNQIIRQFLSPENESYLRMISPSTKLNRMIEYCASGGRAFQILATNSSGDFWGEVRRLNHAFYTDQLPMQMFESDEPYHMQMFESDSLSPGGTHLNSPGLYKPQNWAKEWLKDGNKIPMRYKSIPFWQKGGHRSYEHDIEETLGASSRELKNSPRRENTSNILEYWNSR